MRVRGRVWVNPPTFRELNAPNSQFQSIFPYHSEALGPLERPKSLQRPGVVQMFDPPVHVL